MFQLEHTGLERDGKGAPDTCANALKVHTRKHTSDYFRSVVANRLVLLPLYYVGSFIIIICGIAPNFRRSCCSTVLHVKLYTALYS